METGKIGNLKVHHSRNIRRVRYGKEYQTRGAIRKSEYVSAHSLKI